MMYEIDYGSRKITFCVEFRRRTTMEIAVLPDGTVHIKAPVGTVESRILEKVHRRAAWIVRQQRYFEQFALKTPARQYLSGETHLYLGKQYRLKLVQQPRCGVKMSRGFLQVFSPDLSPAAVQKILERYYRKRAREKYSEYLKRVAARLELTTLPRMQIRTMKTNWGSMSPGGILLLNPELIKAPVSCLEYVITHELCHLRYREHNADFYGLLQSYLPDWEKRKLRLELALL